MPKTDTPTESADPSPAADPLLVGAAQESPWLKSSVEQVIRRVTWYGATLRNVVLHPSQFATQLVAGTSSAMSPLEFAGISLALLGLEIKGLQQLGLDEVEGMGLLMTLALAAVPYIYFLVFGSIVHFATRLVRNRVRWPASAALALYAGAGPSTLAVALFALPVHTAVHASAPPAWLVHRPTFLVFMIGFSVVKSLPFAFYLSILISAAHQVSRWWILGLLVLTHGLVALTCSEFVPVLTTALPQTFVTFDPGYLYIRM